MAPPHRENQFDNCGLAGKFQVGTIGWIWGWYRRGNNINDSLAAAAGAGRRKVDSKIDRVQMAGRMGERAWKNRLKNWPQRPDQVKAVYQGLFGRPRYPNFDLWPVLKSFSNSGKSAEQTGFYWDHPRGFCGSELPWSWFFRSVKSTLGHLFRVRNASSQAWLAKSYAWSRWLGKVKMVIKGGAALWVI